MFGPLEDGRNRDRAKAAAGVALFHLLLGYAFITGLGTSIASQVSEHLRTFDVLPEPPPPPPSPREPARKRTPEKEGAAAPPNLKSKPSPIVAPLPEVRLKVPPKIDTAEVPSPVTGNERSAGAAAIPGPGTGSGGIGNGTGSGGQGTGPGGGGGGIHAVRVSGMISGRTDYPREARRAGIEGSVAVQFTVQPDGSVSDCRVLRSTANEEIDETTCRLIERRFRYEPARDADGRPIAEIIRRTFDWSLPSRY